MFLAAPARGSMSALRMSSPRSVGRALERAVGRQSFASPRESRAIAGIASRYGVPLATSRDVIAALSTFGTSTSRSVGTRLGQRHLLVPIPSPSLLHSRQLHSSPRSSARWTLRASRLRSKSERRLRRLRNTLFLLAILSILYYTFSPFRHTVIAAVRCARLMRAVVLDVWDYKQTFAKEELLGAPGRDLTAEELQTRRDARRACHKRSAERMLEALKTNSGIYVKLGQHVAAVQLLPKEWTSTMTPLQDQCFPTSRQEVDEMLRQDLGMGIDDLFIDFDPKPIGVASLAQVHRATDRRTGRQVAVKIQHADLQEFATVDMVTVNFAIRCVKFFFPDFEFSWLGEEMNEMLPLELDFRHEAANSARCRGEFAHLIGKTSLYLPEVLWAERRCMVMEFIQGSRVDDLVYLKDHSIDRNQVSQELSRIFSQMVYLNGHFHADPHQGNLLIRPKASESTSPFNFDVCLLDHGQYFDIPDDLRVNYAHFWLSLIKKSSRRTVEERKHYAKLVGNIDDDMYPILESAITGRINVADADNESKSIGKRPQSLLDSNAMDASDISKLRNAMMEREGLITSIFQLLRSVPRRLLMILKLSDLTRSLDQSLCTTHGQSRVFIIVARYCSKAVWQADVSTFRRSLFADGLSLRLVTNIFGSFMSYAYWNTTLGVAEWAMDVRARAVKVGLWFRGLGKGGLQAAQAEMAGLALPPSIPA